MMNAAMMKLESRLGAWKRTNGQARDPLCPLVWPRPQPSVRIPVTPENREQLRWLRAAEAAAWEATDPVVQSRMGQERALKIVAAEVTRL